MGCAVFLGLRKGRDFRKEWISFSCPKTVKYWPAPEQKMCEFIEILVKVIDRLDQHSQLVTLLHN